MTSLQTSPPEETLPLLSGFYSNVMANEDPDELIVLAQTLITFAKTGGLTKDPVVLDFLNAIRRQMLQVAKRPEYYHELIMRFYDVLGGQDPNIQIRSI